MKRLVLLAVIVTGSPTVMADAARGQTLHDEHCMKCHDNSVYTRPDCFVKNREGLAKQVKRCQQSLGVKWFDDEVNDVVEYLNASFYNFE